MRNDWGAPNWGDVKEYPSYSGPSAGAAWAWEFLRRSPAYREFWTNDVVPFVGPDGSIDVEASFGKYRSIDADGGERAWGIFKEAEDRFGLLAGPRDPRSDATWLLMAENAINRITASRFDPEGPRVRLSRREVAYKFDLGQPLDAQFARALQDARGLQAHRVQTGEVDVEAARRRAEKYVLYLRLLDAEDSGAASSEIKDALFGNMPKEYPDNRRAVAFRDARAAAVRLRDGGWRALAAT